MLSQTSSASWSCVTGNQTTPKCKNTEQIMLVSLGKLLLMLEIAIIYLEMHISTIKG
jgi:hypothetical protein